MLYERATAIHFETDFLGGIRATPMWAIRTSRAKTWRPENLSLVYFGGAVISIAQIAAGRMYIEAR